MAQRLCMELAMTGGSVRSEAALRDVWVYEGMAGWRGEGTGRRNRPVLYRCRES